MPLARVMILIELFVFTGFVVGYNLLQRFQGRKRLGEFPINPLLFVVGKLYETRFFTAEVRSFLSFSSSASSASLR
jgi:hypothetical protein